MHEATSEDQLSPNRAERTGPPKRHVAVGLIVADDGRVLLQLRDDKPGLPGAGQWGFFGGHLEPGTNVFTFAVVTLGVLPDNLDLSRLDDKDYR